MVLCDSNVWLALALSKHVHHAAVSAWFEAIEEPAHVWFCRATQQALVRLLSNATVLGAYGNPPLTNREAWHAYEALLADDRVAFRDQEPPGIESRWQQLALRDEASPKLWMDAYLAAFAANAGFRLVTTDTAFEQFPGIDLELLG